MGEGNWQIISDGFSVAVCIYVLIRSIMMHRMVHSPVIRVLIVTVGFGLAIRAISFIDILDGARDWLWTIPLLACLWLIVVVGAETLFSILKDYFNNKNKKGGQ